jgi:hypothetical protein
VCRHVLTACRNPCEARERNAKGESERREGKRGATDDTESNFVQLAITAPFFRFDWLEASSCLPARRCPVVHALVEE